MGSIAREFVVSLGEQDGSQLTTANEIASNYYALKLPHDVVRKIEEVLCHHFGESIVFKVNLAKNKDKSYDVFEIS